MKQCPCINCITFPICKAQVNTRFNKFSIKNNKAKDYGITVCTFVLKPKCSLIREWIDEIKYNKVKYQSFKNKRYAIIYEIYK